MLEIVVVVLTASIAVLAVLMARSLLLGDPARVAELASIGFDSPAVAPTLGVVLLAAVAGLLAGWWITPLGIVSIVAIKVLYFIVVIAYKRSGQPRRPHVAHAALSAHSVASIVLIVAW